MQSLILIHSTVSFSSCQAGHLHFHIARGGEAALGAQIKLTKRESIIKAKV